MSHEAEATEGQAVRKASADRHHAGRRVLSRGRSRPAHARPKRQETPSAGAQESKPPHQFYLGALVGIDAKTFAEALGVDGLEEEIALLRLRLRELIKEQPEDFRLVLQGINTLVRAVAAEYQHAGPDQQEMMRRMGDAIRQLGSLIEEE